MSNSEDPASLNRPPGYAPWPALETLRAAVLEFVSAPAEGRDAAHLAQDLKELRYLLDLQELASR